MVLTSWKAGEKNLALVKLDVIIFKHQEYKINFELALSFIVVSVRVIIQLLKME